ncbi:hypothetical protein GCM10011497_19690 [Elstera cyanobacteriorum]|nr:hypothetical protein GCM10011497_19690 [Elstera cyanobacteriorum]
MLRQFVTKTRDQRIGVRPPDLPHTGRLFQTPPQCSLSGVRIRNNSNRVAEVVGQRRIKRPNGRRGIAGAQSSRRHGSLHRNHNRWSGMDQPGHGQDSNAG